MRVTHYDDVGAKQRIVIAGLVTNAELLARVSPRWSDREPLFAARPLNVIGGWGINYFRQYGKPIGRQIIDIFRAWAECYNDKATIDQIERILEYVSDEYEQHGDRPTQQYIDTLEYVVNNDRAQQVQDSIEANRNGRLFEAVDDIEGFERFTLSPPKDTYRLYPWNDIVSGVIPREQYLISDVMVRGQPMIVAAPQKTLKTMLLSDAAVSLATGNDFLGVHEVISPCKVLMMSGESGLPTLAKNFRTIHKSIAGRFGKLPRSMPGDILLSDQVPRINERKHLDAMKALFDDKQPDVLIIDTASLAMPGKDAANLIVQQELLAPMTAVCCERGITFVLIHHMHARTNPYDPPQLDDVAYAGYKEWARQWILLSRQQSYTPPERDGDRIHHLWLSAGGSAGHSQLTGLTINEGTQRRPKWIVEVTSAAKSKAVCQKQQADTHLTSDREIVLDALSRMPNGETKNTIRDATKLNMPRITAAINSLLESGGVERCLVERSNKQKYEGYRLSLVQNDSYNQ